MTKPRPADQLVDEPGRPATASGEARSVSDSPDLISATRSGGPIRGRAEAGGKRRGQYLQRWLLASDLLAFAGAVGITAIVRAVADRPPLLSEDVLLVVVTVPLWIVLAALAHLYQLTERRFDHSVADEVVPIFLATTVWVWSLLLLISLTRSALTEILTVVSLWLGALFLLLVGRALTHAVCARRPWYSQTVLVIGSSADAARVVDRIERQPKAGLEVIGILPVLGERGSNDDLDGRARARETAELVRQANVDRAIVASWPGELATRTELIRALADIGVHVDIVSSEPEALCSTADLHHIEGLPILTVPPPRVARFEAMAKRSLDLVISVLGLLLLSPLLGWVALRIKLDSRGPVFFRQERVGRAGRPFKIAKFRTMVIGADEMRSEMRDGDASDLLKFKRDPRVTAYGARLRRSSMDEIPQLWNVVRGEMSLVGPRPLPPDEAVLVEGSGLARERMRPGITGAWQTLGRSEIPFEDMLRLDYTYVVGWSLREDLRLLTRTAGAVLRRRGAY